LRTLIVDNGGKRLALARSCRDISGMSRTPLRLKDKDLLRVMRTAQKTGSPCCVDILAGGIMRLRPACVFSVSSLPRTRRKSDTIETIFRGIALDDFSPQALPVMPSRQFAAARISISLSVDEP
jgi:hypothetical protein